MTDEKFIKIAERAARLHDRFPRAYPVLVALFVVFGYVGYFAQLMLAVALGVGLAYAMALGKSYVAFPVLGGVLVVIWCYLSSIWVPLDLPEGRELGKNDAPLLHEMVDSIQRKLNGPKIHRIIVTNDFNAMLTQTPKLGIFGWHINTLGVGFTYAMCLSPDELTAVLAHEFGHASGNHGRFVAWLYRVRKTWEAVVDNLKYHAEESNSTYSIVNSLANGLAGPFVRWYAVRLDAAFLVLSRKHEFEADRCSRQLSGAATSARALANVTVRGGHLTGWYWPTVWKRIATESKPPAGSYRRIAEAVRQGVPREAAERYLSEALKQVTEACSTHPCLRERLEAITGESDLSPAVLIEKYSLGSELLLSAGEHFFGDLYEELATEFDRQWQANINDEWREERNRILERQDRKEELSNREKLTSDERNELAALTAADDPEKAIAMFASILREEPTCEYARLSLGLLKLTSEPEVAVLLVEQAMDADPEQVRQGCQSLIGYFSSLGNEAMVAKYQKRLEEYELEWDAAQAERQGFNPGDEMEPHDLSGEQLSEFVEQLKSFPTLARAYVAKKRVRHLAQYPYYIYLVVPQRRWYKLYLDDSNQELLDVSLYCPAVGYVVLGTGTRAWIRRGIEKVPGSLIYEAGQEVQPKAIAATM